MILLRIIAKMKLIMQHLAFVLSGSCNSSSGEVEGLTRVAVIFLSLILLILLLAFNISHHVKLLAFLVLWSADSSAC